MKSLIEFMHKNWPILLTCFAGILFFTLQVTGYNLQYFPGDLGDARFNTYLLEHSFQYFTGKQNSFWNAPFMFPEKNVLSYSDTLVGVAPLYILIRLFISDPLTAFQWFYILITILNLVACYAFLYWTFKNKYGAAVGAFVFTFSIALQSQMTHAQTFSRFAVPIAFWMALLFYKSLQPRYFFAAIFCVVYEIYAGIYLGFMLLIPVSILMVLILVICRKDYLQSIKSKIFFSKLTFSLIFNLLLLVPLFVPYLKRSNMLEVNSYAGIANTIPSFHSFLTSKDGSFSWSVLKDVKRDYPAYWDHQLFPGGIALLSLIFFLFAAFIAIKQKSTTTGNNFYKNTFSGIIALCTVITFLLYLRVGNFSLYQFIFALPGFSSMRSMGRIINIELIFYAFATGFVWTLIFRKNTRFQPLIFVFFLALLIADNYLSPEFIYHYNKSEAQQRNISLMQKLKSIPPNTVISYEPENKEDYSVPYQLDAMLSTQQAQLKCINGYTATSPQEFTYYWNHPNEGNRLRWLRFKEDSLTTIMVIH